MVGGRSYNQSQFNRAVDGAPAAGLHVQAVRLSGGVRTGADEGRADVTPGHDGAGTSRRRGPSTTRNGRRATTRTSTTGSSRCAGRSRCRATSPPSRWPSRPGFDRVAAVWRRARVGEAELRDIPSIALGVFELSPMEVATAYTLFPNGGAITPLAAIARVVSGEQTRCSRSTPSGPKVARPATTFLVTNMMRSVLNEGTGAGARAAGLRSRRRRQVGDDQRPARRLVRRLHARAARRGLGRLRRQPAAGLERHAGGRAHLGRVHDEGARRPRQRRRSRRLKASSFVEIDRDTGKLAGPDLPSRDQRSFPRRAPSRKRNVTCTSRKRRTVPLESTS